MKARGCTTYTFDRGRTIKKGIDFPFIGQRNSIDFHNVDIKHNARFTIQKFGTRNGYVFEASVALPRLECG